VAALQFATRLEVNGKPFIEAYGAYKEQEKLQMAAEEAKKQRKPEMTKEGAIGYKEKHGSAQP
jgi:hypothetical protein